ncbi:hypothetical protein D9M68_619190 [compost metagenome]
MCLAPPRTAAALPWLNAIQMIGVAVQMSKATTRTLRCTLRGLDQFTQLPRNVTLFRRNYHLLGPAGMRNLSNK